MASYVFTNNANSFTVEKDGTTINIARNTLRAYVSDSNPQVLKTSDTTKQGYPESDINLDEDTVNVTGQTVWADAYELLTALEPFFFLASGLITGDVDIMSGAGITTHRTSYGAVIYLDPSSGNIIETLPSASLYENKEFALKRVTNGTNYVSVSPSLGEFIDDIDDSHAFVFGRENDSVRLISDGSNWKIIQRDTYDLAVIQCATPSSTQVLTAGVESVIDCFDFNVTSTSGRLTADQANNKITIDSKEDSVEPYHIHFKLIGEYSVNLLELDVNLYVGGVLYEQLASQYMPKKDKNYTILGDTVITFMGSVPSDVQVKVKPDVSGTITYEKITLSVDRNGG